MICEHGRRRICVRKTLQNIPVFKQRPKWAMLCGACCACNNIVLVQGAHVGLVVELDVLWGPGFHHPVGSRT